MAFHIVTNRCFLACEKVTSVTVEELAPDERLKVLEKAPPKKVKKGKKTKKPKKLPKPTEKQPIFCISISYYPLSTNGNNYNNQRDPQENCMEVRVAGQDKAFKLYSDIIREVQEQHPNEAYLDNLIDKVLAGEDFKILEPPNAN